jgi:MOSC domain-containing protein YiiM
MTRPDTIARVRGTVVQVNVSAGGIPKLAVASARVTADGVEGDWQRNRKYHGGPNRAVCIFSVELYQWLREKGIDLANGSVGENLTTCGLDLSRLAKGDRLLVGESCVVEITDVRVPCGNLKRWDVDLPELIVGNSGWVGKVVSEGVVRAGDSMEVLGKMKHEDTKAQRTQGEDGE